MTDFIGQKTKVLIMHKAANYTIVAFIFLAAIFYMYFANTAVRTLTVLEKTKQHLQSVSMEVSEMESKRLAIENDFNTERALALGFVEVKNPVFIIKDSGATTLSFNKN